MAPVVDRLKGQYEGKVEFRLMNVEKDAEGAALMDRFGAQFVPTFVFVNSDGTQSQMLVGEMSEARLKAALDKLK